MIFIKKKWLPSIGLVEQSRTNNLERGATDVSLSSPTGMRRVESGKRRAESLVEVVIAIFVIAMGAGIASSLIVTSLQSNSFSRDNLIALNLAVEGIEAMRSIRDTNWLKNSFDRENCWHLLPDQVCPGVLDSSKVIQTGYYTVNLDGNYVWQLTPLGSTSDKELDLENGILGQNSPYQLKAIYPNQQLWSDVKFYTPKNVLCSSPCVEDNADPQNLRFYRMIQVEALASALEIHSVVQWKTQGRVHKIFLPTTLTNYQQNP